VSEFLDVLETKLTDSHNVIQELTDKFSAQQDEMKAMLLQSQKDKEGAVAKTPTPPSLSTSAPSFLTRKLYRPVLDAISSSATAPSTVKNSITGVEAPLSDSDAAFVVAVRSVRTSRGILGNKISGVVGRNIQNHGDGNVVMWEFFFPYREKVVIAEIKAVRDMDGVALIAFAFGKDHRDAKGRLVDGISMFVHRSTFGMSAHTSSRRIQFNEMRQKKRPHYTLDSDVDGDTEENRNIAAHIASNVRLLSRNTTIATTKMPDAHVRMFSCSVEDQVSYRQLHQVGDKLSLICSLEANRKDESLTLVAYNSEI